MRTTLDCLPCFVRQALEAARFAATDEGLQFEIMRESLAMLAAELETGQSPPQIGQRIHRLVRRLTDDGDPYAQLKRSSNSAALAALPRLRALMAHADDPLAAAVHLAISANVLDAGMNAAAVSDALSDGPSQDGDGVAQALQLGLAEPLHGDVSELRAAVTNASSILFLADNCGEIVVDRLLIEQLPNDRLTIAVRGAPVLNDATLADAVTAGLDSLAPVIENGSDAPGTLLPDCSPHFREMFHRADLVIAKGQGNYETLSDTRAGIFFLFKVKCPLVAHHSGLPLQAHALLRSPAAG
jgi:uncharacterized protein with ATP-grasp and redox domains